MNTLLKLLFLWLLLASITFMLPGVTLQAAIFKYVDEHGAVHFVDDASKIPPRYQNKMKKYKGKYDHLPEKERRQRLAEDKKKSYENKKRALDEWHQNKKQEEARQAHEAYLRSLETEVIIRGNRVLVPTVLCFQGREVEALLLLDTGAGQIAIHKKIADRLNITETIKTAVRVAGGKVVEAKYAKLTYVKAGAFIKRDIGAFILKEKGPAQDFDGLLGMNFLRGLDYKIDFRNHRIIWNP